MTKFQVIVSTVAAALLAPTIAFAHAELVKSDPAKDGTLSAAAKEITLTFEEAVKPASCKLTMSDGMSMANIGKPHAEGLVIHVPISKALPAGKYSLECRVVGPDSHPVNNTLTFVVSEK
jgi:methionine-rich copper-binding protein CopC